MLKERSPRKLADFLEVLKKDGISFDIDGLEALTAEKAIKLYNQIYGKDFGYKSIEDHKEYFAMSNWLKEIKELDPKVVPSEPTRMAINIWNDPNVVKSAELEMGVRALTKFLSNHEIVPYRITQRPGNNKADTIAWYQKVHPDLPKDHIFVQKEGIYDSEFKVKKILELGVKFHLEDSWEQAELIAEQGVWVGLVPHQPWSRDYQPSHPKIVKPDANYLGRPGIIRAFLALADNVAQSY